MSAITASKRSVVITGASSGFGAAMAKAFAAANFDLVLCGRDITRLSRLSEGLRAERAGDCEILSADLQTPDGLATFAEGLKTHDAGTVINNAAVNPELTKSGTRFDLPSVSEIISVNTSTSIAIAAAAFDHLASRGGGTIINMNSAAGLRGSSHEPIYAASKFGLRGFSESVKDAWYARGVRMIDVYAGAIATGMSSARADLADLIDPNELSTFIVNVCTTGSFVVRELNVQKSPPSANKRKKIVFANGVFDLLHPGHLELLKFAKSLGDTLVVGINSDNSVRALKGPDRPVQGEQARKAVLESLRFVDKVVIFDELRTTEVVQRLKPDVIVKGGDYASEDVRAVDAVPDSVAIVTFPIVSGADGQRLSTTAVIEKSRNNARSDKGAGRSPKELLAMKSVSRC